MSKIENSKKLSQQKFNILYNKFENLLKEMRIKNGMDYMEKQKMYFDSLPCKEDCEKLFSDILDCTKNNINYKKGSFKPIVNGNPNCFDFTKCEGFKKLGLYPNLNTIKYNIGETKAAYTRTYEINFNNGDLELHFDWRDK